MKSTKLEIVRYLLGENINKPNRQMISNGDKNVNYTRRTAKRYKQYFWRK